MSNQDRKEKSFLYRDAGGKGVYKKYQVIKDGSPVTYWENVDMPSDWKRSFKELEVEPLPYMFDKIAQATTVFIFYDEIESDMYYDNLHGGSHMYKGVFQDIRTVAVTCLPDNTWDDSFAVLLAGKEIIIVPRCNEKPYGDLLVKMLHNETTKVKLIHLPFSNPQDAELRGLSNAEWFRNGGDSTKLANLIKNTQFVTSEYVNGIPGEPSILSVLANLKDEDSEAVLRRVSAIRSESVKEKLLNIISKKLGKSPEELKQSLAAIASSKANKVPTVPEASELRLPGLIDIAYVDGKTKKKVFLMLDKNGVLQAVPHVDGYINGRRVRFVPPDKTEFILPVAGEVLRYFEKDDSNLFQDILTESRDYVVLKEIDRVMMVTVIFLSYIIHHKDVECLPIICMVSEPNHGKTHVMQFSTQLGYRGKCYRSFNLPACIRYNDEFNSLLSLDVFDFAASLKSEDYLNFVLGKIESTSTIPKVNRPSAGRYEQVDEYNPYGLLIIGSNTPIPGNLPALKSRILPIENVLATDKANIKKPDKPEAFLHFKNRLTAWKARVMKRNLRVREYLNLEGRLFDMAKPILMVLNEAHPESYDKMVQHLGKLERQRLLDKSDSSEATILSIINRLVSEARVAQIMNGSNPKSVAIYQQKIMAAVKEVIPKITSRGIMKIFRDKFGFRDIPKKESDDYLHWIDIEKLNQQLEAWGLKEREPVITIEVPIQKEKVEVDG